jgi:hypothetical protein
MKTTITFTVEASDADALRRLLSAMKAHARAISNSHRDAANDPKFGEDVKHVKALSEAFSALAHGCKTAWDAT